MTGENVNAQADDTAATGNATIKTMLIPVDGSDHAHKAAFIGGCIAAKFGARVILLHILLRNVPLAKIYELAEKQGLAAEVLERLKPIEPVVSADELGLYSGAIDPVVPTGLLIELGRRILENEKSTVEAQGVKDVPLSMEDGDAAETIIEIAKRENAGFVVMGRRGLGAFQGMLSGSVSTKVGHLAASTVVSVT
jgi:nucleotide-binding universal stress UspA family protein